MAKKIKAYVDTSALISFLDKSDTHHALFSRLFSDPPPLITSPLVIAEGHGWFLRRYDINRAIQFMGFIEKLLPLTVVSLSQKEIQSATDIIRKFSDQDLTLADAMGLLLMREHKIKICWSTDFHLGITGIPLVIHG